MTTAILYDPRYLDHDTGAGHPERPARLSHVAEHLKTASWFDQLHHVEAAPCDQTWIETIHDHSYVERARQACREGQRYIDTPDVAVSSSSFDIALLAAGGALSLADAVIGGRSDNGFAMIRPPGHHAENNSAMGFCLFNNVAIVARYLQRHHGLDKILILDWDVHHGNGTQHAFESDPSVFYISTHQYPWYPGTGAWSESGTGAGKGATLNCPMSAGDGEREYREAFERLILPAARAFKANAILISAGFDAHANDPLGDINLGTDFYRWMTLEMMALADASAEGRIISLLEGGYDLDALAECIGVHVGTLAEPLKSNSPI
ncbi:MAG: acetoin utilization protein [marine bacterium B5-7]|nr:MAG: acetoin utilization protein [marine bacterium B5-7]